MSYNSRTGNRTGEAFNGTDHTADPITIGVSGSRLLAIMSKLTGQGCDISMTDPSCAIVIEPTEQHDDCEVLMLTMPMLLNE